MNCKHCGGPISSSTYTCQSCGKLATREQINMLKNFKQNSGWDNYTNPNTHYYKSNPAKEYQKKIGIFLIPIVILILLVIALLKIKAG